MKKIFVLFLLIIITYSCSNSIEQQPQSGDKLEWVYFRDGVPITVDTVEISYYAQVRITIANNLSVGDIVSAWFIAPDRPDTNLLSHQIVQDASKHIYYYGPIRWRIPGTYLAWGNYTKNGSTYNLTPKKLVVIRH